MNLPPDYKPREAGYKVCSSQTSKSLQEYSIITMKIYLCVICVGKGAQYERLNFLI